METEKPTSKTPRDLHEETRTFNTLGFAIYDVIHIVASIIFIIYLSAYHQVALDNGMTIDGNYKYEMSLSFADYFVELIMSFLLIAFIVFIYKAKTERSHIHSYSFAWLLAALSLFIPSTFEIPDIYLWNESTDVALNVLRNFDLYLPLAAVIAFVVSLFFVDSPKKWRVALYVGIGCMVAFVGTSITVYSLADIGADVFQKIVRYIFSLAPLVPAAFSLISLRHLR